MRLKDIRWNFYPSWQWILFLYFLLPALYFLFSWFIGDSGMGRFFGELFRVYSLYVMSPIVKFNKAQGIVGILLPAFFCIRAVVHKSGKDLLLCIAIVGLVAVCFFLGVHEVFFSFLPAEV